MARILLFGSGSIGTAYAFILCRAGAEVVCVCRSNYEAVKCNGFRIESTVFGNHTFKPTVVRSVTEAVGLKEEAFDYIVICTKSYPGENSTVASKISPAMSSHATNIVLIQNGLGIENEFKTYFPSSPIISGVAYMPTTQVSPGFVVHTELERLHLGMFPASNSLTDKSLLEKFANLINKGGATAILHEDVQVQRWKKIIANGTWNPVCALSRCRDVEFLQSSAFASEFIKNAMSEVCMLAESLGYADEINAESIEWQMSRTRARPWPGVEPSMMADMRKGRGMEVEAVIGYMIKMAKENSIAVPRLETLYVLLAGLDFYFRMEEQKSSDQKLGMLL
ncbi:ketopantoate reductase PanE/ApbA-domain-containing protein [Leptodontidium sp. 2 PMI_412]|nr:ketopantoate reductase PanE/ApbA-domain-containing protein [Leptodontidium sp. 2 PMI_412]